MTTRSLLKKLVSIPSPFFYEKEIGEYLFDYLKTSGFTLQKVKTEKDRYNIIATYGVAKKYLAFYGHMDTIPPELNQKSPYRVSITGNKAKGLGVEDMKGGIAAILKAGKYAVKNKYPVKLIFGVDEENISQGAHDLVDSGLLNDISFLIVGESGQIENYRQAFSVCYGRKGRILFDATIFGKKAHAAESDKAINAIEQATAFVRILQKMRFAKHHDLGKAHIIIHSFISETDSFSIPEKARILFSLLTTPTIKSKDFIQDILLRVKKQNIAISLKPYKRITPYSESYAVDRKNTFLKLIEKNIFIKYSVHPIYASSVADENVFAHRLHIPVISLGPIGGGGHTAEEWVDMRSLETVEVVYKQIIELYNKL